MTVTGVNTVTISQGNIVYRDGDVRTVKGAGRYIDRPCFAPVYGAMDKRRALHAPVAVNRAQAAE